MGLADRLFANFSGDPGPRVRRVMSTPAEQWNKADADLVRDTIIRHGEQADMEGLGRKWDLLIAGFESLPDDDPLRAEINSFGVKLGTREEFEALVSKVRARLQ